MRARGVDGERLSPFHQRGRTSADYDSDIAENNRLPSEKMKVLDAFRRARNLSDYEGEPVEDAKVRECIEWAEGLLEMSVPGSKTITRNCSRTVKVTP